MSRFNLEKDSHLRQALPQITAVCVKNLLLFIFGMTLGFPTILIPSISGKHKNENISLGLEAVSWIGSVNLLCVPLGCFVTGTITQAIGRKRAMMLSNVPLLAAFLIFHFANEVWQIFLALGLTGFTGGLLEAPTLTYVAEITQPHLRGILASTSTMSITLGILTQFVLGTSLTWRRIALINAFFPIMSVITLCFIPESPIWLISKNRLNDAQKSLAWLRGWTTVEKVKDEFKELHENMTEGGKVKKVSRLQSLKLLGKKSFLWPYFVVSLVFFLGHFNGNTTLGVYAIKIFETLQAPLDKYFATAVMGSVQLLGCIVCGVFINIFGKRIITFISLFGSAVCFMTVAIYAYKIDALYLQENNSTTTNNITNLHTDTSCVDSCNWISVVFLILSAFFYYFGIRPLPWMLIGEVYSNETRATASGLSGAMGYVIGSIANKTFITLTFHLTLPVVFAINAAIGFIGIVVLYFLLPETEGKSLHEITEHFAGVKRLSGSVRRRRPKVGRSNPAFEPEIWKRDSEESKL